jgi:hypothetical protein
MREVKEIAKDLESAINDSELKLDFLIQQKKDS